MCGYTFTVFLSAFMLLPAAPYRILAMGGGTTAAGAFLGCLTYSSAFSAPLTGALVDRLGKRRVLVACSLVLAALTAGHATAPRYELLLVLALVQGVFWSALLSASSAYVTDIVPASRRAEGIGYWGLSTIAAVAVAPALGFWLFEIGWPAVCLASGLLDVLMAAIATFLRAEQRHEGARPLVLREAIEWRVLLVSGTLFLYSFGYGSIQSFVALHADAQGIKPRTLFFTVFAVAVLCTRPFAGPLADRLGHRQAIVPCLVVVTAGLGLLAASRTASGLVLAAIVFGSGFATAYPALAAHVVDHVPAARRGAAFGSMLAAFDTGIGTGSTTTGLLASRLGLPGAFTVATALAALSLPWFLLTEKRLRE